MAQTLRKPAEALLPFPQKWRKTVRKLLRKAVAEGAEGRPETRRNPCGSLRKLCGRKPLPLRGRGPRLGPALSPRGGGANENSIDEGKRNMRTPIEKKIRFAVFERDGFRCTYCGQSASDTVLHIDHVKPVSKGGTNDIVNLVTACIACNLGKGAAETARQQATQPIKIAAKAPSKNFVVCPFTEGWPNEIQDPVYYCNENWVVTRYGLESLTSYYPIEANRLGEKRIGTRHSDWMVHVAEKVQFAASIEDFINAFTRSLFYHLPDHGLDLGASVKEARRVARQTMADNARHFS